MRFDTVADDDDGARRPHGTPGADENLETRFSDNFFFVHRLPHRLKNVSGMEIRLCAARGNAISKMVKFGQ
jgi:hypothetical protein